MANKIVVRISVHGNSAVVRRPVAEDLRGEQATVDCLNAVQEALEGVGGRFYTEPEGEVDGSSEAEYAEVGREGEDTDPNEGAGSADSEDDPRGDSFGLEKVAS